MRHVLSLLVQNKPGVISKISGMFRRKNFQIDAITSGATADFREFQVTIVFTADEPQAKKIAALVSGIIEVLALDLQAENDLGLAEVAFAEISGGEKFWEKLDSVRVVDQKGEKIILEIFGSPAQVDEFLALAKKISGPNLQSFKRSGAISPVKLVR